MTKLARQSLAMGSRPALIVVDMIYGFTDSGSPLGCESETVIEAGRRLLEVFRRRKLPVIFTTVAYSDESQAALFRRRLPPLNILTAGSRWSAVDERLAMANDEILIIKHYASGFFGTDLKQRLSAAGADSLVVAGLTTSGCVRATAVDALQHDYAVFVPRQAVGDRDGAAHEANLRDLHSKYADVMDLDDLLALEPFAKEAP